MSLFFMDDEQDECLAEVHKNCWLGYGKCMAVIGSTCSRCGKHTPSNVRKEFQNSQTTIEEATDA